MFVEAELGGSEGELAPFADGGGDVAGLLEDGWGHGLDGWLHETSGVLVGGTGTEGVAAGENEGAGGAAEGGGIGVGVAGAAAGELIDVGCFEVVRAVAAYAIDAEIVGEDEDDVGLGVGGVCLAGRGGGEAPEGAEEGSAEH
ncbi:MAG: hypothetical protein NTV52_17960 [Acidobacteria bacterium]|nr:hypothetical protein [Acidobacteriota bacterium]